MLHRDLRNSHYLNWIEFLKKSESWSKDQIEDYQLKELKRIIRLAIETTQGYREIFSKYGLNENNLICISDILKFPLIDKETIRDNLLKFSNKKKAVYVTTGGSTGIPFGFYRTKEAFAKELASKAFQYYRIGWKEEDRQLVFRGLPIKKNSHMSFFPSYNELRCSSYYLTPDVMDSYLKRALKYKPEWLRCYPSSGYIFARYLKETGKKLPGLKGILCASENLYDYQKKLLYEVFDARVFSHYGHYEMSVLAGFCEYEDTYHVLPQYGFAELLDKNGRQINTPGQIGEIVATSFLMEATPFIRYRTKDFAVFKSWSCPSCGREYQVWEKIEGRLQEFVVTGNGRMISMTAINMHDDIFNHIKQFQFVQEAPGKLIFNYIPKADFNEDILKDIKRRLLVKLSNDIELSFSKVNDIPLTKRGKYRFLIQKLPIELNDE